MAKFTVIKKYMCKLGAYKTHTNISEDVLSVYVCVEREEGEREGVNRLIWVSLHEQKPEPT